MLRQNFSFTKRQLGYLLIGLGIIAFVGIISVDIIRAGGEGGIGPAQRIALGLAGLLVLLGISLIPLGDRLA
ncbi:MAG: hypothetical protein D6711_06740 [Chloroflexi bacterium]|nr:MAG: hypothetical protein D6711_06740 [Chloroflexota bacterium]